VLPAVATAPLLALECKGQASAGSRPSTGSSKPNQIKHIASSASVPVRLIAALGMRYKIMRPNGMRGIVQTHPPDYDDYRCCALSPFAPYCLVVHS
jgi:hypothetical protein